jgi:hypothetical protein
VVLPYVLTISDIGPHEGVKLETASICLIGVSNSVTASALGEKTFSSSSDVNRSEKSETRLVYESYKSQKDKTYLAVFQVLPSGTPEN